MIILGIETSCDETGIALIEAKGGLSRPKFRVIENLVSSQIKIHAPFGGVVPNLAKREHIKNLPMLLNKLSKAGFLKIKNEKSKMKNVSIDLITVTVGPGLEPALWTGINFAKNLAEKYKKLLIGANHLEGHLYSFLLPQKSHKFPTKADPPRAEKVKSHTSIFPAIALIVSGGHTILLHMESFSKWKKLGETVDDAAGEAFDKVARLLGLPYPGGPEIEKIAKTGNSNAIHFPRPMMRDKSYNFSFSGLKTSVLYYIKNNPEAKKTDIAASFQKAALDVLVYKAMVATREYGAKTILVSGGVAANNMLRNIVKQEAEKHKLNFFVPEKRYNLDNAAMIAASGYFAFLRKKKYALSAKGDLKI